MIASPLNYTGGKFKLLPQILPLFPQDTRTFVDLFCGGCNVGVNVPAQRVIYNDIDPNLIALYRTLKHLEKDTTFAWINQIIGQYGLSNVSENGYAFYQCNSSDGLAKYNRPGFMALRNEWNRRIRCGSVDDFFYVMFYVVIVYAFNNQIRYNSRGEYNLPVGKRDFNTRMRHKLSDFIQQIQTRECCFTCQDFRAFPIETLDPEDFVYADPPYLISCATYNENGGWGEENERALLAFLDELNARHIRFALSNVLRSKGKENQILLRWLADHPRQYHALPLRYDYSNSSYHTKDRTSGSEEVFITNYECGTALGMSPFV